MNFKMKFAAIAALSIILSAPAFAVTDFDMGTSAVAADAHALASAEFLAHTLASDGNVAFINQEGASNLAAIDQMGATNFASIQQVNSSAIATIYQVGDSNRANVYQH